MRAAVLTPTGRALSPLRLVLLLAAATLVLACSDDESTAPTLGFLAPLDDDRLTADDDVDSALAGVQIDAQLAVIHFDHSGTLTLEVEGDPTTLAQTVVAGDATYLFNGYSLPEGELTLLATLLDSDGGLVATASIGVSVRDEPAVPPTLAFDSPSPDGLVLTDDDDVDEDPFNGLQIDVAVSTLGIPVGTPLRLSVGASTAGTVSSGATGATFEAVTLPVSGPEGTVELLVQALVGEQIVSARRRVVTDIDCSVSAAPEPGDDACDFGEGADEDPAAPGLQRTFTVLTNCPRAEIRAGNGSDSAFVVAGEAELTLTLAEGDNAIVFDASDTNPARTTTLGPVIYVVDTEAPSATLSAPEDGAVLFTDRDGNPDNGFQVAVAGATTGTAAGTSVDILVDGAVGGTATTDVDGLFLTDLTLTAGAVTLGARVTDACENAGVAETVSIEVVATIPLLSITSPATDSALLADGDPDGGLYEATFEVTVGDLASGTDITVQCRRPFGAFTEVGRTTFDGSSPASVPVTLANDEWFCRAQVDLEGVVTSSPLVHIFVDNIAPTVSIVSPADGSSTPTADTSLEAFVRQLDAGGTVTLTLNGGTPTPVTLVDDGLVEAITLAGGANTLTVTAQEIFDPDGLALLGNSATDSVSVTYDSQAPSVTFLAPTGDVDDSDPRLEANFLYDVLVATDEVSTGGAICLRANTDAEVCVVASAVGEGWEAEFFDVFLLPGANQLTASVTDDAGNVGTAVLDFTFNSSLARLEWLRIEVDGIPVSPVDGARVGGATTYDLVLQTDVVVGTSLTLTLNGSAAGTVLVDAAGVAELADVALLDENDGALSGQGGFNEAVASLTADATQVSPLARVRVDTTAPTIAFTDLTDGLAITLVGGFVDASPQPGFQLAVALTVGGVESGLDALIDVDCDDDAFDDVYSASVGGSPSVDVDVPDEGACTLTASVSDTAGNAATPAVVALTIDVSPPTCSFPTLAENPAIDSTADLDLGLEGIQIDIDVLVTDADGSVVLSSLNDVIGPFSEPSPGGGDGVVIFDHVTVPDGDLTLRATLSDVAGNLCTASVDIAVFDPDVTLSFFGVGNGDFLNVDDDRSADPGFQGDFQVLASSSFAGEPLVMCRALAPGGTSCLDPEYEIVGSTTMVGATGNFLNVFLPESTSTTLLAELDLGAGRVQSLPVTVCVDTVRPTIESWTLTNDVGSTVPGFGLVGDGDGFLNAAEAADRRAQVSLVLGGLGGTRNLQIFSTAVPGTPVATGTTTGTFAVTTAALPQGTQTLSAVFTDACGNGPEVGAPTLVLTIDTVPAQLSWEFPADAGAVLAADDTSGDPGAQATVSLLSDAIESSPVRVSGLTLLSPPTLDPDLLLVDDAGRAAGAASLIEGSLSLSATLLDRAANPTTATASVLVDVTPPTIALTLPGTIADADEVAPGFQLDVTVTTTQAETGQLVIISSSATGGQIGTTLVGTTTGPDLDWTSVVRLTMPVGDQELTASVSDSSGNPALSVPVSLTIDVVGCGLVFSTPTGSPVLVDAVGYGGSGPKAVDARLVVIDIAGCADAGDPATVRVRVGCSSADDDSVCARIYSAPVEPTGEANFTGPNALQFNDGEVTTMHGIVTHPVTSEVSVTVEKSVVVDLVPPLANIERPGVVPVEQVLSRRDTILAGEWTLDGTTVVGPLRFAADDVYGVSCLGLPAPRARCSYTVRYGNGTILIDAGGAIQNRAINTAGPVTVNLAGVRYPTMAGVAGGTLEVHVADEAGNSTVATVSLNVDVDPPPTPGSFVIDGTPYVNQGRVRSGRSDLSWTASTDDAASGSNVARYELRALCTTRTVGRTVAPGAPSQPCGTLDWATNIANWESRPLVATITDGSVTHFLGALGLDEVWTLGVRAFDEADNWSIGVNEGSIDTRLQRRVIGTFSPMTTSTTGIVSLGDINGDGRGDLLVTSGATSAGGALLLLGEADPANPTIPGNPFTILAPVPAATFFGSSAVGPGNINGDAYDDFVIGSTGFGAFGGNNMAYVYFGGPTSDATERSALVAADSAIVGPAARSLELVFLPRNGSGNFTDFDVSEQGFDDLVLSAVDFFDAANPADVYIIGGRTIWPAVSSPLTLTSVPSESCALDAIQIRGVNPPSGTLPTGRFGLSGGLGDLNDDTFADLVASTLYPGSGDSSAQYVFYGGSFPSCPTNLDLSAADEVIENFGGASTLIDTMIALNASGGEYAAGIVREDAVELHQWDDTATALTLMQTVALNVVADRGDIRFGITVGFAGDLDQAGGVDLLVGGAARNGGAILQGRIYLVAARTPQNPGDPRYATFPDVWMTTPGASRRFGDFVATDFDYNGDGLPDVAVTDQPNANVTLFW